MINRLLKFFGWFCDPEEALPVPTYRQNAQTPIVIPDDIRFDAKGKSFKVTDEASGSVSDEVTIGRTASRTYGDDVVLATPPPKGKPKLSPNKYFRLKVFWAKGLSAKDTANALKNEKGFGVRTLDYYWKAFAMSQKLDIEEGVKTPLPSVN